MALLTYRMARALKDRKPIALLAYIDHPDGAARLWTGLGTLTWDGNDYTGAGVLGAISPVQRSTELAIQELTFALSGIPPETTTWLSSSVRNRTAQAWLACIDNGRAVPDPYPLIDCQLDYQTLSVQDDGTATVALHALSGFYTLERSINEVWSSQSQKAVYPHDTGFDMIDLLQNQEVKWSAS